MVVLDIMNNPGSLTGCPVSIEEVVLSHRLAHLHAIRSQFVLGNTYTLYIHTYTLLQCVIDQIDIRPYGETLLYYTYTHTLFKPSHI